MDETNPLDPVKAAKEHVKGVADDLHAAAEAKATQIKNVVEDARSRAQSWQTQVAKYIQLNPTKAVFMALGVGFVLSRRLGK
jgi:ElaB/YqjD/DUF883 family membrane-anchored ribosome-binding protein